MGATLSQIQLNKSELKFNIYQAHLNEERIRTVIILILLDMNRGNRL